MAVKKKQTTPPSAGKAPAKKRTSPVGKIPKPPGRRAKVTSISTPLQKAITARNNQFHIVGMGASAGGLEAFEAFFKVMPSDSGLAFILVVHLDPGHVSILPEILQKHTKMKVRQVEDNMKVAPNQVYIIPPNREIFILNGTLQLMEMSRPRGVNLPIDTFFRSLAQDQGDRAIGIILSGTGADGTLGIRAIKGEAGMIMVQDVDSAKYDGMPRSAAVTGMADFILPPSRMPEQLLNYVGQPSIITPAAMVAAPNDATLTSLQKIYVLLRTHTNHDFSLYKKNTICRRIERRMHIHQIVKIADYVRYLQESEREVGVLFKELLIGVTNFFRDPDVFVLLQQKYLLDLLKKKPMDSVVRVWVPGCSSGEEVYSLAIILRECMEALGREFPVQIFGTDIDEEAISLARSGMYPESISADVDMKRLAKFFVRKDTYFQIKKSIRGMVIFASQNIIKDPPFTKLDLVSCRNLLIYLGPELQYKLLPVFHHSLRQDGLLVLGSSETIGRATDLFAIRDKKWKIYSRRPDTDASHPVLVFPAQPSALEVLPREEVRPPSRKTAEVDARQLLQAILAESDLPACVIIDDAANILYVHGRTGHLLEPAQGAATSNILEMARTGLKQGLANAIGKMADNRQEVLIKGLRVHDGRSFVDIDLMVRPLSDQQTGRRGLMMVIFNEIAGRQGEKKVIAAKPARRLKSDDIRRIEGELQYTRENLQTTIEELETANEELQSTNEELQSTNEELQSTNEEMETSKEELQSLNEEASTVNAELQSRIDELTQANDDIKNLLDSANIATIFLDIKLCIRRFTPSITAFLPLLISDTGRPISHFASSLNGVDLEDYGRKVLNNLAMQEAEVQDRSGKYYRMRLRVYRTLNNVIDGVVVTFEDITELKKMDQEKRLAAIVRDSGDAITLLDNAGNIKAWNRGAKTLYGYTEAEALNMNILDLVPKKQKEKTTALLAGLKENEETRPFVSERVRKNGEIISVWLTVTRLLDDQGRPAFIACTERDLGLLSKEARQQLIEGKDG